jgi:hypothetical protein
MTWSDKRETGFNEDAPRRTDNWRERQIRGPKTGPGRSPELPMARGDENYVQLTIPFDNDREPHDD